MQHEELSYIKARCLWQWLLKIMNELGIAITSHKILEAANISDLKTFVS